MVSLYDCRNGVVGARRGLECPLPSGAGRARQPHTARRASKPERRTTTLIRFPLVAVLAGCLSSACTTPHSPPSEQPLVGSIEPKPTQQVEVAIVWSSPNEDAPRPRVYLYRVATTADGDFAGAVPAPPAEPRWQGVSIGVLVALPPGFSVPDGPLDEAQQNEFLEPLEDTAPLSEPLIFRDSTGTFPETEWIEDFPIGVSCTACQPVEGTFDNLVPASCEQVVLKQGGGCNWS